MRIGHGYDLHRLEEERKLVLCGVTIPFEKGLLGHSDADVAVHALIDALLGAAALGDIGKHFPDTDEQYRDANSIELLKHVVGLLAEKGYWLGNADVTIIAQAPKLAPHILRMRKNLAEACGVELDRISVKATTEEGLGVTGDRRAICAHAVVLLEETE
ncbi:MAG TPA: 2-C-methyl-D-erythritol 2,4-cyclodiphosphate synthase [Oscillospiraceae bacterium]|nr:2-C-methyl-D-erythritol 2,4-cyclodiphosphate synthase [Oscillospiraceae bacterium]HPK34822.1 2-C-methyl-D-erythritol 2,4-cyclodiphosphate synthase [Oscillospiraceae bacterium]HPR76782.1 2-C-methyl-D-erythritol 2,4-cyclodiphosphate synthase [Oscillospiraceae bacterium]